MRDAIFLLGKRSCCLGGPTDEVVAAFRRVLAAVDNDFNRSRDEV
jgi:hypothetical protein